MNNYGTTTAGRISRGRTYTSKKNRIKISETGKKLIKLAVVVILVVFTIVSLAAYTATLQHENNKLQSQNDYLQAEIDALDSQITEQTKVTKIEKTATEKYGMVYPSAENCITIEDGQECGSNLAATIKAEAYN